jgi:hypothetical protein
MRRVIGMDLHRTLAEVVFWEDGRLRWYGRADMTRSGLEGFGRSLSRNGEVVTTATGNAMAAARVLSPYVARVVMANPLQVKAIAQAHVNTDKIDAGVLASLHAAGFLPEEVARCRDRAPAPPGGAPQSDRPASHPGEERDPCDPGRAPGSAVPARRAVQPARSGIARLSGPARRRARGGRGAHLRELDRLGEDLAVLDHETAEATVDDPAVRRLLTIPGMNLTVAAGLVAAIGDIHRFRRPAAAGQLFRAQPAGPAVRARFGPAWPDLQEWPLARAGAAGRGRLGGGPRHPVPCTPSSCASGRAAAIRSPRSRPPASWQSWSVISWPRRPTISGRVRPLVAHKLLALESTNYKAIIHRRRHRSRPARRAP